MPDMAGLGTDAARLEGYFVELLDKLERIATVMERFENIMNPGVGLAEEALREQMASGSDGYQDVLRSTFLGPVPPAS
jgi:hypothetical protein